MKERLADKHCVPCRGGVPPLEGEELQTLVLEVGLRSIGLFTQSVTRTEHEAALYRIHQFPTVMTSQGRLMDS